MKTKASKYLEIVIGGLEHRTVRCAPDSVRCARLARLELAALGKLDGGVRLKFTGLSGVHRTVR